VAKKLSATELSKQSPMLPVEPSRPAFAQPVPERPAGVGRAVIAVVDGARRWAAVPDRHLQRVDDQLGADVVGRRPPDD
jgi:hypothetical protein